MMFYQECRPKNIFRLFKALFVIFFVLIILSSGWLAENVFSYTVVEERTIIETKEIPKEKVNTFICYITKFGEHYHSQSCGYLWNSSYQTTVYEAKQKGYKSCSKCEPTEPTEIILTETLYIDKHYSEEITYCPQTEIILVSCSFLLAGYIINTIICNRKKSGNL